MKERDLVRARKLLGHFKGRKQTNSYQERGDGRCKKLKHIQENYQKQMNEMRKEAIILKEEIMNQIKSIKTNINVPEKNY